MCDSENSIAGLREQQLVSADGIVARCAALCERVLISMGENPDASVVQLHHDCMQWSGMWHADPVRMDELEDAMSEAAEEELPTIWLNGHDHTETSTGGAN